MPFMRRYVPYHSKLSFVPNHSQQHLLCMITQQDRPSMHMTVSSYNYDCNSDYEDDHSLCIGTLWPAAVRRHSVDDLGLQAQVPAADTQLVGSCLRQCREMPAM